MGSASVVMFVSPQVRRSRHVTDMARAPIVNPDHAIALYGARQ